jgi:hypothetical protein
MNADLARMKTLLESGRPARDAARDGEKFEAPGIERSP